MWKIEGSGGRIVLLDSRKGWIEGGVKRRWNGAGGGGVLRGETGAGTLGWVEGRDGRPFWAL